MRKSGLADSPFFKMQPERTSPPRRVVLDEEPFKVVIPPNPDPLAKVIPTEPPTRVDRVTEQQSTRVTEFESNRLTELQTYRVDRWDYLRRLELRLTKDQKRYLNDLEEEISQAMPEIERDNPEFQRLTKNSIIRVLVEIIRQLDIRVDASQFHNEGDLLQALYSKIRERLAQLRE
jgi:hypothetical protein